MEFESRSTSNKLGFVYTPYLADESGRLLPSGVESCPKARKEGSCHLIIAGWRKRVFGPGFKLCIYYCRNHAINFTVYPPGWSPHSRMPIVPLAYDGSEIPREQGELEAWKATIFSPIVCASLGELWIEEKNLGPDDVIAEQIFSTGVLKTQRRGINFFMRLFAISKGSKQKTRERIAEFLSLDLAVLEDAKRRMNARPRDGPLVTLRGKTGLEILNRLVPSRQLFIRLANLIKFIK